MQTGAITSYIDVAQLTLYAFWIFFAGLVYYLCRENKREGYPLIDEQSGKAKVEGYPGVPSNPKGFIQYDGSVFLAPREEKAEVVNGTPIAPWAGAALAPTGDAMLSGMGPGAYAQHRADVPDHCYDDHGPKIVPLRAQPDFFLATEDPDVIGMTVHGLDGVQAGTVVDAWVDRSEVVIRYLEVELDASIGAGRVLLPMNFMTIKKKLRQIRTNAILAKQFADVPRTRNAETVTILEEEKILGYYGGGLMYATAERAEPIL